MEYDTQIIHTVPEYWPRWLKRDKLNIGMTVWETTHLPAHWRELLQQPDRLLVPASSRARF